MGNELKHINKGIMKKDGKPYLPITHESLVVDSDGISIDKKYVTNAYIRGLASEYYVEQYVDEYVTYHLEPIKDVIWNEETGLLKRTKDLEDTTREGGEIYESIEANKEAIEAENERASKAEDELNNAINLEIERAIEAENELNDIINTEVKNRIEADTILENKILDEQNRATTKETELDDKISNNKKAIDILNGDVSVIGSVANTVNVETERAIEIEDKLKEWIDENRTLINTLNGSTTTEGSVKKQLKDIVDSFNVAIRKLCNRITNNKKSIDVMNGEEDVEGSIKNEVSKALANIMDELNSSYFMYDEDVDNMIDNIYKK